MGRGVGASESASMAKGALDIVGSILVLGATLALGTALPPGAALVVFVEFVSGQLVAKSRAGIIKNPSQ